MHWLVYVIISIFGVLALFFTISYLKVTSKNFEKSKKDTKAEKEQGKEDKQQVLAKEIIFCDEEEKRVSPAIFDKESIIREYNQKFGKTEQVQVKSTEVKNRPIKNNEQPDETVVQEINSLSSSLKAILFTDVIKPKS